VPRLPSRSGLIAAAFALAAVAVVARAAQLQLFQVGDYRERAREQQTTPVNLPARRGTLFDRNGVALAESQESFGVGVAPRDLDDPSRAATLLARALDQPRADIIAVFRSGRVWVEWPGPFTWSEVSPLAALSGVTLRRRLQRFYARPGLAPRLIGRVDVRGRGGSGLERTFDSVLAGKAGNSVMLRDARGNRYPSPSRPSAAPIDGADVVLTLDAELQEIAERALSQAVTDAGATGGDVIILQPGSGEILAIASVRHSSGGAVGVIGDPYEPGSTAKIFAAAALLRTGKATPHDTVFAENGVWRVGDRTIHDEHKAGIMTLEQVIRQSSNIGIAKLGARLTQTEQFETLRDFGFGTPTGIEYPGEAAGRLRRPNQWSNTSAAALAMGYELNVTPIQLASAYGAFANRGILVEPTLVREVRERDGTVRWRHGARPIRRVVSEAVADQLSHMLLGVVEEGTGRRAALGTYQIAGKTGTVRRNIGGRYVAGRYTASFVGLFPAVGPQLILLVKIDDPEGDYFGGFRAAPVVRTILEAALATPAVTLDRTRLSRQRAPDADSAPVVRGTVVSVGWPLAPAESSSAPEPRPVPDVTGQNLRAAVRMLHRGGFRARVVGWGNVTETVPAAGSAAQPGATVVVRGESPRASR